MNSIATLYFQLLYFKRTFAFRCPPFAHSLSASPHLLLVLASIPQSGVLLPILRLRSASCAKRTRTMSASPARLATMSGVWAFRVWKVGVGAV